MASTTMALGVIHGISPEIHKQTGVVSPSILVPSVSRATLALSCRFHIIIVVVVIFFFFRPSWIS